MLWIPFPCRPTAEILQEFCDDPCRSQQIWVGICKRETNYYKHGVILCRINTGYLSLMMLKGLCWYPKTLMQLFQNVTSRTHKDSSTSTWRHCWTTKAMSISSSDLYIMLCFYPKFYFSDSKKQKTKNPPKQTNKAPTKPVSIEDFNSIIYFFLAWRHFL